MQDQRAAPQLTRLVSDDDQRTATLVSGWIRREDLAPLVERVARALGETLPSGEPARVAASVAALPEDDEDGLECRLPLRHPVIAHFLPHGSHTAVDVLLEGEHELLVESVHEAFAASTVDPLAA